MPKVKYALLRQQYIDELIRSKRKPSIEQLREHCEFKLFGTYDGQNISKSSIEKDLKELKQEYDAPIEFDRIKKGYFYSDPNFSIKKIKLSERDDDALRFAALTLKEYEHLAIFKDFSQAINKIFDRIYISERVDDAAVQHFMEFEKAPQVLGTTWLNPIFKSIKNHQKIKLSYQKLGAVLPKNYVLSPLLLKEYNHRWYVLAQRSNLKLSLFELGRISQLELLDEHFDMPTDFSASTYFKNAFGITVPESIPEKISLRFTKNVFPFISSKPLHGSQEISEQNEDNFLVSLLVFITPELILSLLSYGANVTVLAPQSLAIQVKEEHLKAAQLYS